MEYIIMHDDNDDMFNDLTCSDKLRFGTAEVECSCSTLSNTQLPCRLPYDGKHCQNHWFGHLEQNIIRRFNLSYGKSTPLMHY